ncbi:hypothetical protein [Pseudomonas defluvii]|uniref:hypothetical protein n=1 Tax=Pseudomonas defluvii TaxID=1876757 RepID=UPI0039059417
MLGSALAYGVYHLSIYMFAALAWLCLCLLLTFNAHLLFPQWERFSRWTVPLLALAVCLGLLVIDVLKLLDKSLVITGLIVVGLVLPTLAFGVAYRRLRTTW